MRVDLVMRSFSPGVESEAEEEMTCHHEPGDNTRDHSILALSTALLQKGKVLSICHLSLIFSFHRSHQERWFPDQGWREFRPSKEKSLQWQEALTMVRGTRQDVQEAWVGQEGMPCPSSLLASDSRVRVSSLQEEQAHLPFPLPL